MCSFKPSSCIWCIILRTWCTTMWIISTDRRCVNLCHTPNFDGSNERMFFDVLRTLTWARSLRIHPSVIFTRSISSIRSIYTTDTQTYLSTQCAINRPASEDKLLATLYDKQRYVHYRNLQQCTRHSLRNKDPPDATIRSISMAPWLHWTQYII